MKWKEVVFDIKFPEYSDMDNKIDWCKTNIGIRGVEWNCKYVYPNNAYKASFSFKNPGDATIFTLLVLK